MKQMWHLSGGEKVMLPGGIVKQLSNLSSDEKSALVRNERTTDELLCYLIVHGEGKERADIVRRPRCSEAVLRALARSPEVPVRVAVAGKPNCPIDVLRYLAEDDEAYVQMAVAHSHNTPPDILHKLYKRHAMQPESPHVEAFISNPAANAELLHEAAQNTTREELLFMILTHDNVAAHTAALFVGDSREAIRTVAMEHPQLPDYLRLIGNV